MTSGSTPKLPVVQGRSQIQIELQTQAMIQWHYPQLLSNPRAFPVPEFSEFVVRDTYSFKLGPRKMPTDIEGYCDTTHGVAYLREDVYELMCDGDGRARFTTCHEIGHLVLHSSTGENFTDSDYTYRLYRRKGQIRPYEDPEWQANAFAAALLMPIPAVQSLVGKRGWDISAMREAFLVSSTAATRRLEKLEARGWLQ